MLSHQDGAFYPVVHCDDVEFRHFKSDTPTWHPKTGGYAEDVHACYDPDPAVAVLCFVELFALLCQICSFCALQKAADLGEAAKIFGVARRRVDWRHGRAAVFLSCCVSLVSIPLSYAQLAALFFIIDERG